MTRKAVEAEAADAVDLNAISFALDGDDLGSPCGSSMSHYCSATTDPEELAANESQMRDQLRNRGSERHQSIRDPEEAADFEANLAAMRIGQGKEETDMSERRKDTRDQEDLRGARWWSARTSPR